MLVARTNPQPLTPVRFGTIFTNKTLLGATLFYSVYQNDNEQYHVYPDSSNNSVMAAWNSGGKVDIDTPVYGGGMVTFRFSDSGSYFGFAKLEAGAPVVAVSTVHATLFTLAPVSWGGTLEKKFMIYVEAANLVLGLSQVSGDSKQKTAHGTQHWTDVHDLQLQVPESNPKSIAGAFQAGALGFVNV